MRHKGIDKWPTKGSSFHTRAVLVSNSSCLGTSSQDQNYMHQIFNSAQIFPRESSCTCCSLSHFCLKLTFTFTLALCEEVGHGLHWGFNFSMTITCQEMLLYLLLFLSSRHLWTWPLGACFRTSLCGYSSWLESAYPSSLVLSGMQTQLHLPARAKRNSSMSSHCSMGLFTRKYDK